ncbi:MAG: flagellar biosynthetic protein FliQ [Planctomycetota bacterium]|jgi:flagellar biosynthetic protein FliQ
MDELVMIDLGKQTLITALMIVAPALLVGMFTGLAVSLFQTITALQEQTLSIVPKMLAVVGTLLLLMPWILRTLYEFAHSLFTSLPNYGPITPT